MLYLPGVLDLGQDPYCPTQDTRFTIGEFVLSRIATARNVSIVLGLIGAVAAIIRYAPSQPSMPMVGLVFIGCLIFWVLVASTGISFLAWLRDEAILMGRWPRVRYGLTPFKAAMLCARMIGVAAPFVLSYPVEGWAVLTNPERWATVPITLVLAMGFIAIPLWLVIKIGGKKLSQLGIR